MPKLLDLTKNAAEDEMKAIGLKADFAYEKGSSSDDSDLIVVKQQYKKGDFHYCSRKGGSTGFGELYRKESRAGVKEAWP